MRKAPPKPRAPKKDHSFRVGGRAGRLGYQKTGIAWSGAYKKIMLLMRDSPRASRKKPAQRRDRVYDQRVIVRIRYATARTKGQWKAHGRYIERESASVGCFGDSGPSKPSRDLKEWQAAGDERIWKVILSPENELDLQSYTQELIKRVEKELGQPLIWTAAVHENTDHNHVHLVIRGIDKNGQAVKLSPSFVKQGMRLKAQGLATEILGHRLDQDIILSQRRMITHARFTDLDRMITSRVVNGEVFVNEEGLGGLKRDTEIHIAQRLEHLAGVGLAEKTGERTWTVSPSLERSLRAVQETQDLQQMQSRFGVLASDHAQPFRRTDWKSIEKLEGRVLVHGQEDNKDPAFMLIETVDGTIHFLEHRNEIVEARKQGLLQPGAYVAMRKHFVGRKVTWIVEDHGPAEACVTNGDFIEQCVRRGVKTDHGYGGWLGRFREAVGRKRSQGRGRI